MVGFKGTAKAPSLTARGRGTGLNPANRFEPYSLHVLPEALDKTPEEVLAGGVRLPTRVYVDASRTVLNRVDSPDLDFHWTLNPYRGCETGCVYCLSGETRILMADGTTRPLAELVGGEEIYGTLRRGWNRRLVKTRVLARWETRKPAYRVELEDGTSLVGSADHRFLTLRGWKHVYGTDQGADRRPHLTTNDRILGIGHGGSPPLRNREYMRGYLCGIIRGDGLIGHYEYERVGRGGANQHQFRLALTDREALARASTFLMGFGVATREFVFQKSLNGRRELNAIRTHARRHVQKIEQLVAWPDRPSLNWSKGFLAGIFDAEGSYSDGVMRIPNTDAAIINGITDSCRKLGYPFVCEVVSKGRKRAMEIVRITGGIREHMRFFQSVDPAILRKRNIEGVALRTGAKQVVAVEPIDRTVQLFDITTGTGDFIANGVVSHNCYARPTHETLGFSCGLDFESRLVAKPDAPRLLRSELASPSWKGEAIALSGVTDPYQPLERKLQITRGCLEVMAECRQPVSVVTKSRLVTRDIDLLSQVARYDAVTVGVSVTTLDPKLAAVMEPRASRPADRLRAVRQLADAGIPVMVYTAPIIPGLNDCEIPRLLEAAAEAGARSAHWMTIRLPHQVKTLFLDWLRTHFPDRAARVEGLIRQLHGGRLYDSRFDRRHRGRGPVSDQIASIFDVFARRYGLHKPLRKPTASAFRTPVDAQQLRLFEQAPPEKQDTGAMLWSRSA
jgi:DNA repair photolyase